MVWADAKDAVAMGAAPGSGSMSGPLRAEVMEGRAPLRFINGVHTAVTVTGTLCLMGAVVALVGLRGALRNT
ncbi:hypothetical protein ACWEBX_38855 [Streptomyces sp. NPDC005070]